MLQSLFVLPNFHLVYLHHQLRDLLVLPVALHYQQLILLPQLVHLVRHFLHVESRLWFLLLAHIVPSKLSQLVLVYLYFALKLLYVARFF